MSAPCKRRQSPGGRLSTRAWLVALIGTVALSGVPAALAQPAEQPREILATGDAVPGLGRLGDDGFRLLGIGDDGRLLISGDLSDGRVGLFWADAHQLDPLWVSGDTPGVTLELGRVQASPGGQVVTRAHAGDQFCPGFYYVFSPGSPPQAIVSGPSDERAPT